MKNEWRVSVMEEEKEKKNCVSFHTCVYVSCITGKWSLHLKVVNFKIYFKIYSKLLTRDDIFL